MKAKIKTGIIGGAGYTGGELIRLLLEHPHAEISFVHSKSNAGNKLYHVHEDLMGTTEIDIYRQTASRHRCAIDVPSAMEHRKNFLRSTQSMKR